MNNIILHPIKNEARVDSLAMAEQLQLPHKNVLALVDKYKNQFEELGRVTFQTRPFKTNGGLQKQRVSLLNEDQSYLLLTFSRNTQRVVGLKVELVKAFSRFRRGQQAESDYLPFYHELHDSVKVLADHAHKAGSTTSERFFHININRLINDAFGLVSGQRPDLPGHLRAKVTAANIIAAELLEEAIANGYDHKAAYQHVKQGIMAFANSSVKRLEVAA
ncbi:Rha family transcriptional regulator [Methylobacter sp.]|uniref:Rha family transcriptional regulator n=1 Tax=Methylobacter sp. TaxID=2051955 RepID=UPI002488E669|nr:Rha family transcriptional regulator [Methylobacter sp.]MDI1278808.1 Rha family transcriptional regulator [Methylobacter sp.]MDI1358519.1 Rha family transcriptional regulator [Methylobacter sp.]